LGYGGEVQDGEWDHVCARRGCGLSVPWTDSLAIKAGGAMVGVALAVGSPWRRDGPGSWVGNGAMAAWLPRAGYKGI